jgi:hypothetical protein
MQGLLEVQFKGETGFDASRYEAGVTQGFYSLVASELQRRSTNEQVPMWVSEGMPSSVFLSAPARTGLFPAPLPEVSY